MTPGKWHFKKAIVVIVWFFVMYGIMYAANAFGVRQEPRPYFLPSIEVDAVVGITSVAMWFFMGFVMGRGQRVPAGKRSAQGVAKRMKDWELSGNKIVFGVAAPAEQEQQQQPDGTEQNHQPTGLQQQQQTSNISHPKVTGYCVKCKARREILDPEPMSMKNGSSAVHGKCPVCGKGVFRIGGNGTADDDMFKFPLKVMVGDRQFDFEYDVTLHDLLTKGKRVHP